MDSSAGTTAIGVGALGFGVLLVLSAFTKTPLFGPQGLLTEIITTGDAESYGKAVGKALANLNKAAASATGPHIPQNTRPPGGGTRI